MRKTVVWTADHRRDTGKEFLITEMPADQAERWGLRALIALANAGAKMPEGALDAGMAGLAASMPALAMMGIRALQGMEAGAALPLLDEMMECVRLIPPGATDKSKGVPVAGGLVSQIEEVKTRLQLKGEILKLHMDFSLADALSSLKTTSADESAPSA